MAKRWEKIVDKFMDEGYIVMRFDEENHAAARGRKIGNDLPKCPELKKDARPPFSSYRNGRLTFPSAYWLPTVCDIREHVRKTIDPFMLEFYGSSANDVFVETIPGHVFYCFDPTLRPGIHINEVAPRAYTCPNPHDHMYIFIINTSPDKDMELDVQVVPGSHKNQAANRVLGRKKRRRKARDEDGSEIFLDPERRVWVRMSLPPGVFIMMHSKLSYSIPNRSAAPETPLVWMEMALRVTLSQDSWCDMHNYSAFVNNGVPKWIDGRQYPMWEPKIISQFAYRQNVSEWGIRMLKSQFLQFYKFGDPHSMIIPPKLLPDTCEVGENPPWEPLERHVEEYKKPKPLIHK